MSIFFYILYSRASLNQTYSVLENLTGLAKYARDRYTLFSGSAIYVYHSHTSLMLPIPFNLLEYHRLQTYNLDERTFLPTEHTAY